MFCQAYPPSVHTHDLFLFHEVIGRTLNYSTFYDNNNKIIVTVDGAKCDRLERR